MPAFDRPQKQVRKSLYYSLFYEGRKRRKERYFYGVFGEFDRILSLLRGSGIYEILVFCERIYRLDHPCLSVCDDNLIAELIIIIAGRVCSSESPSQHPGGDGPDYSGTSQTSPTFLQWPGSILPVLLTLATTVVILIY